ncbi:hypothetical protein BC940DRAFT_14021 [Gongronella butleri]|nr:hypothetical protein BC940DRAFT_14021 [Gongronella butleri]
MTTEETTWMMTMVGTLAPCDNRRPLLHSVQHHLHRRPVATQWTAATQKRPTRTKCSPCRATRPCKISRYTFFAPKAAAEQMRKDADHFQLHLFIFSVERAEFDHPASPAVGGAAAAIFASSITAQHGSCGGREIYPWSASIIAVVAKHRFRPIHRQWRVVAPKDHVFPCYQHHEKRGAPTRDGRSFARQSMQRKKNEMKETKKKHIRWPQLLTNLLFFILASSRLPITQESGCIGVIATVVPHCRARVSRHNANFGGRN